MARLASLEDLVHCTKSSRLTRAWLNIASASSTAEVRARRRLRGCGMDLNGRLGTLNSRA